MLAAFIGTIAFIGTMAPTPYINRLSLDPSGMRGNDETRPKSSGILRWANHSQVTYLSQTVPWQLINGPVYIIVK